MVEKDLDELSSRDRLCKKFVVLSSVNRLENANICNFNFSQISGSYFFLPVIFLRIACPAQLIRANDLRYNHVIYSWV